MNLPARDDLQYIILILFQEEKLRLLKQEESRQRTSLLGQLRDAQRRLQKIELEQPQSMQMTLLTTAWRPGPGPSCSMSTSVGPGWKPGELHEPSCRMHEHRGEEEQEKGRTSVIKRKRKLEEEEEILPTGEEEEKLLQEPFENHGKKNPQLQSELEDVAWNRLCEGKVRLIYIVLLY